MRLATLFGRTLREAPSEAEHIAHQLVLRAGLVRQLQAGSYAFMPLGMRVARRIEAIMHEEMASIDAQEFRTPLIQAASVWEQSGRYSLYGPLILQMTDRSERALIFAPTHEEAITELARREIASYRQMPALVYQITTKYRDELRAKGGLMRLREFTMLDAYSLDADQDGLDRSYALIAAAFDRIFERCGVRFVVVAVIRGDLEVNEAKLCAAAGVSQLAPASAEQIAAAGAAAGYASPVGLLVQTIDDRRQTTNSEQEAAPDSSSIVLRPSSEVFV